MAAVSVSGSSASSYYYESDPIFNSDGFTATDGTGKTIDDVKGSASPSQENTKDQANNVKAYGKLLEEFGVRGDSINNKQFTRLVNGQNPKNGNQLTKQNTTGKQRGILDNPTSAPKSVSHAALVLGIPEVLKAHEAAVATVARATEAHIDTRTYNSEDKRVKVNTNAGVILTVQHSVARPVNGQAPDPHLHSHILTANITKYDGKYQSIDNTKLFKNQSNIRATYINELRSELEKAGISTITKGNAFEIKGYNDQTLKNFSKRNVQVQDKKAELAKDLDGVSSVKIDKMAQHQSKSEKAGIPGNDLVSDWRNQQDNLSDSKDTATMTKDINNMITENKANNVKNQDEVKKEAFDFIQTTATTLANEKSVFTEAQLIHRATQNAQGQFSGKDITEAVNSQLDGGDIKKIGEEKGKAVYSTKETINLERENVELLKKIMAKDSAPLLSREQVDKVIADYEKDKGFSITKGQNDAVHMMLSNGANIKAIQGDAGVGKTTMLELVKRAEDTYKINTQNTVIATSGKAAVEAQKASGLNASTGHSFLARTSNDEDSSVANKIHQDFAKSMAKKDLKFHNVSAAKSEVNSFKVKDIFRNNGNRQNQVKVSKTKKAGGWYSTKKQIITGPHAGATQVSKYRSYKEGSFKAKSTIVLKDGTRINDSSKKMLIGHLKVPGQSLMIAAQYGSSKNQIKNEFGRVVSSKSMKTAAVLGLATKIEIQRGDKKSMQKISVNLGLIKLVEIGNTKGTNMVDMNAKKADGSPRTGKRLFDSHTINTDIKSSALKIFNVKVVSYDRQKSVDSKMGRNTNKIDDKQAKEWKETKTTDQSKAQAFGFSSEKFKTEVRNKQGVLIKTTESNLKKIAGITYSGSIIQSGKGVVSMTTFTNPVRALASDIKKDGFVSALKSATQRGILNPKIETKTTSFTPGNLNVAVNALKSGNGEPVKIVYVDEASMMDEKTLNSLLKESDKKDFQMVFVGDTKQLSSVQAGQAFNIVQQYAKNAEATDTLRQGIVSDRNTPEENKAINKRVEFVSAVKNGDGDKAVSSLPGGAIKEVSSVKEQIKIAAQLIIKGDGDTIGLTATRETSNEINKIVVENRRGNNPDVQTHDLNVREDVQHFANKADGAGMSADTKSRTVGFYQKGDIVETRPKDGSSNKTYKVMSSENGILKLKDENGKITSMDTKELGKFVDNNSVSHTRDASVNFAKGDTIIIKKNNQNLGINNGETGKITEIKDGNNGKIVSFKSNDTGKTTEFSNKDHPNFGHGNSITVHKSQGITQKNAVVIMGKSEDSLKLNANIANVAFTRHTTDLTILTEKKEDVSKMINNKEDRTTTRSYGEDTVKNNEGKIMTETEKLAKIAFGETKKDDGIGTKSLNKEEKKDEKGMGQEIQGVDKYMNASNLRNGFEDGQEAAILGESAKDKDKDESQHSTTEHIMK